MQRLLWKQICPEGFCYFQNQKKLNANGSKFIMQHVMYCNKWNVLFTGYKSTAWIVQGGMDMGINTRFFIVF